MNDIHTATVELNQAHELYERLAGMRAHVDGPNGKPWMGLHEATERARAMLQAKLDAYNKAVTGS
jgi:hypothetical protein